jgi:tartrate-resistant acid phosphatase type 5
MQIYSETNNVSFILSLGDNFYPSGVSSVDDIRFEKTYRNVYLKNEMKNIPWYIILGNHDHRYNKGKNQVDFGKKFKLWNIPDYFYDLNIFIKSKDGSRNKTAKFIMIDTSLLCNLFDRIPTLDKIDEFHFKWLKEKLESSTTFDYIFVIGHHTILSQMSGRGGSQCMMNSVNPLLLDFNISSYISGHDHTLQHNTHFNDQFNHTVHYFVSGAGSNVYKRANQNLVGKNHQGLFYWNDRKSEAGFMTLSLNIDNYEFRFKDSKGRNLHSGRIISSKLTSISSSLSRSCDVFLKYYNFLFVFIVISMCNYYF